MKGAAGHEVVQTRGGALAMRSREAGEVMHPGVGPLREAQELYVRQSRLGERLRAKAEPLRAHAEPLRAHAEPLRAHAEPLRAHAEPLRAHAERLVVFDVGLGAGSNALAARAESERAAVSDARLELVSFERDLGALALALDHGAAFGLSGEPGTAARALLVTGRHQTPRTDWRLQHGDVLVALARESQNADVVFWDPFSPRANPSLWTVAAFTALRRRAASGCCVFTYSASTATRIALLLAGWSVGVGEAIGDKAQTTAAAVRAEDLARPLDRTWLGRLARPEVPLPLDAPRDAVERVRALPQFE